MNGYLSEEDACDPEALAVCKQLTAIGAQALVRLDGSDSSDPNGDALTFKWTVNGGLVCEGLGPF